MAQNQSSNFTGVKERIRVSEPGKFQVILHNDHYTSMDFVVMILMQVFHKEYEEAYNIMMNVHRNGFGICGIYTKEIAESKIARVHSMAKEAGYPLRCSMQRI